MEKKHNDKILWQVLKTAWGLGFVIVWPVVAGAMGGVLIDKTFHIKPIATISLIFLGTLAGIYTAVKETKKILKQK